jgi:hypothetical protein
LSKYQLSTFEYILLKTLAFHTAEHLWALELGASSIGWREKREFALFLSRSALSLFSRSFFFALSRSFLLRARERESARKAPAPASGPREHRQLSRYEHFIFRILISHPREKCLLSENPAEDQKSTDKTHTPPPSPSPLHGIYSGLLAPHTRPEFDKADFSHF